MDKLRDQVLSEIAIAGHAYTNEVKAMAEELIELRAKHVKPEPITDLYMANYSWLTP